MTSKKDEKPPKSYPNLEIAIRDRKSYIVLNALRRLGSDPEKYDEDGFWPKAISKFIASKESLSFKPRYVRSILTELVKLNVVEKVQKETSTGHAGAGYCIPIEISEVLEEIHDSFEKAKRLGGRPVSDKHYLISILYEIDPQVFFNHLKMIRITEKMREIGFKTINLEGEEKNETWDWSFVNTQPNLVEIIINLAEMDADDMNDVFGRKEAKGILMELHVHVREQHRLFNDEFFVIKTLNGKKKNSPKVDETEEIPKKKSSFLLYGNETEQSIKKSIKQYCSHLGHSTLVQVNEVLRSCFTDITVMTMKSKKGEILIEEKWENW